MTAYDEYKARTAETLIERAFRIAWTPEVERTGEDDLQALWSRLAPDDRLDALAWLAAREAESGVDP